ncbi:hypothetical protein GCM10008929_14490 [Alkalibacterium psychrotolerans]
MLFKSKPQLFMQFFDRSIRYLVMDTQKKTVIEKDELVFDTTIIQEGQLVNVSLLETRLDALIKEKKWKNAKVSIILPDDFVTIREEDIPSQLNETEIKDYLNLHINQSIRLPFDNPKVELEVLEKKEQTQTLLLVAYPGEQVTNYLDLLSQVSLKPEVADISSLCVYRILLQQNTAHFSTKDHVMVLQWNPVDTTITVFNEGIPQFNRHTRSQRLMDSWKLSKDGQWDWTMSDEELVDSLTEQLNGLERFIEFYRYSVMDGQESISDIILSGYFPDLNRLEELLNDRFSIKVHTLNLPNEFTQADAMLYGSTLKESKRKESLLKAKKQRVAVSKTEKSKKKEKPTLILSKNKAEGEVAND